MKKKIILALFVFAFAVFSVAWSYSLYGKKVSENTSGTPDGKIFVCRKYSEISKVIAIDSKKKSHRKEVSGWNYDTATGILLVTEDLLDFEMPVFHIEGKPTELTEFILWNCDLESGPVAVFMNGKIAVENREYVIDESKTATLTLKVSPKDIESLAVVWHTSEGLSSISEMSQSENDLYAELQGAWFTENAKKSILAQTETPYLDFSECIDGNAVAAYVHGDAPKIVMKEITADERQKMIDALPVNAYKYRQKANMKKLSNEAGFKINLPQKCGDYKIVSAMLIESALKGEKTKSVEFSYDKGDFFTLDSINVEASKSTGGDIGELEYLISTETMDLKSPVTKYKTWTIGSEMNRNEVPYKADVFCIYTWTDNETSYKVQCVENRAEEVEALIRLILK